MSILVTGISLPFDADTGEALHSARRMCGLSAACPASVYRSSIDARHSRPLRVYSVLLQPENDRALAQRLDNKNIQVYSEPAYNPDTGCDRLLHPPVVAGFGPAGMFAALLLARKGYRPTVLERGGRLEERDRAAAILHAGGGPDEESNIQFGEGGAGAYSDGKLTTRINDPRCRHILREFCRHGAPPEILTEAQPHVGTDRIRPAVRSIHDEIIKLGGRVLFHTCLEDIRIRGGRLAALSAGGAEIAAEQLILATGHSARDTCAMLLRNGLSLLPKSFSCGVRIEHLQHDIDRAMYGKYAGHPALGAASYQLVHREAAGVCYSFCMCPGGTVVAAASERGGVVTNGMSEYARNGRNANAALAIPVHAELFSHPLEGIEFQRKLERAAYEAGGETYAAPAQTVGDFLDGRSGGGFGEVMPTYPCGVTETQLDGLLPPGGAEVLRRALRAFGRRIRGFDDPAAVLTAPETRTSAPVRICRGEDLYGVGIEGVIPCGEGAGYAGGIMSAAADGLRAAEAVMARYTPME